MRNTFATEEELTLAFLQCSDFKNAFNTSDNARWQAREVEGLFGIPDFMIAYKRVSSDGFRAIQAIAFEMKIKNWRRALTQAFRYLAFAHYAYVVMDDAFCRPAIQNIRLFRKSNIGLLSIDQSSRLNWHFRPCYQQPYSLHLYKDFYDGLNGYFQSSVQH